MNTWNLNKKYNKYFDVEKKRFQAKLFVQLRSIRQSYFSNIELFVVLLVQVPNIHHIFFLSSTFTSMNHLGFCIRWSYHSTSQPAYESACANWYILPADRSVPFNFYFNEPSGFLYKMALSFYQPASI